MRAYIQKTISYFLNTAHETQKAFPEMADACSDLQGMSPEISEEAMSLLERFMVLKCDRISDFTEVNEVRNRKHLYSTQGQSSGEHVFILPMKFSLSVWRTCIPFAHEVLSVCLENMYSFCP